MLRLAHDVHLTMVAHALDDLPCEACGLLAATPGKDLAEAIYRCRNAAASACLYEVHPFDQLQADRDAESRGLEIVGVYHSHTHTRAYPSETDKRLATYPEALYFIVSLVDERSPYVKAFYIHDGVVTEEPVEMV